MAVTRNIAVELVRQDIKKTRGDDPFDGFLGKRRVLQAAGSPSSLFSVLSRGKTTSSTAAERCAKLHEATEGSHRPGGFIPGRRSSGDQQSAERMLGGRGSDLSRGNGLFD